MQVSKFYSIVIGVLICYISFSSDCFVQAQIAINNENHLSKKDIRDSLNNIEPHILSDVGYFGQVPIACLSDSEHRLLSFIAYIYGIERNKLTDGWSMKNGIAVETVQEIIKTFREQYISLDDIILNKLLRDYLEFYSSKHLLFGQYVSTTYFRFEDIIDEQWKKLNCSKEYSDTCEYLYDLLGVFMESWINPDAKKTEDINKILELINDPDLYERKIYCDSVKFNYFNLFGILKEKS